MLMRANLLPAISLRYTPFGSRLWTGWWIE
jgi:hypothetical protein